MFFRSIPAILLAPLFCLAIALTAGRACADGAALRIGVNASHPPFGYVDSAGEMAGFDVDMARALCKTMDRDCEISLHLFAEILPALVDGALDMAVAGITVTEERKKSIVFSDKYFQSRSIFVVRKGFSGEATPETLKGLRLAAVTGSVQLAWLKRAFPGAASVSGGSDYADIFSQLRQGAIDAILVEGLAGYYQLRQLDDGHLEALPQMVMPDEGRGTARIALSPRRADLAPEINKAIRALRQSGEYDRINRRYFDFDVY